MSKTFLKNSTFFLALFFTCGLGYSFQSPFKSTVKGVSIPNTHFVAANKGIIYRGSAPLGLAAEIKNLGITDVLIFKNQTKYEVEKEKQELLSVGYSHQQIYQIPFLWKDIPSFQQACQQTIEALNILKKVYLTPKRALFFHCTVGEDRTGYLSALFKMLVNKSNAREVFRAEMCANGYEAGNRQKNFSVVRTLRQNLTPIFLKMATLIEAGQISIDNLSSKVCNQEVNVNYSSSEFVCKQYY